MVVVHPDTPFSVKFSKKSHVSLYRTGLQTPEVYFDFPFTGGHVVYFVFTVCPIVRKSKFRLKLVPHFFKFYESIEYRTINLFTIGFKLFIRYLNK